MQQLKKDFNIRKATLLLEVRNDSKSGSLSKIFNGVGKYLALGYEYGLMVNPGYKLLQYKLKKDLMNKINSNKNSFNRKRRACKCH